MDEAGVLPVALNTMHNALVTWGRLAAGQSGLVQGANSGVGLMALQIAKLMGAAVVIGTSTTPARRGQLPNFAALECKAADKRPGLFDPGPADPGVTGSASGAPAAHFRNRSMDGVRR